MHSCLVHLRSVEEGDIAGTQCNRSPGVRTGVVGDMAKTRGYPGIDTGDPVTLAKGVAVAVSRTDVSLQLVIEVNSVKPRVKCAALGGLFCHQVGQDAGKGSKHMMVLRLERPVGTVLVSNVGVLRGKGEVQLFRGDDAAVVSSLCSCPNYVVFQLIHVRSREEVLEVTSK